MRVSEPGFQTITNKGWQIRRSLSTRRGRVHNKRDS